MARLAAILVLGSLLFLLITSTEQADSEHNVTIFGNIQDKGAFYKRIVELDNGDLLATWMRDFPVANNFIGYMKSFYFYKSSDQGRTWKHISTLDPDDYPGLSREKQGMHALFVFPQKLGDYPAGTVLFATNDWDDSQTYTVHVWRSTDNGKTWQRHSDLARRSVSAGGRVWEPEFAVSSDGRLICYYADERQSGYDQCLALETSDDGGLTWDNYSIIVGKHEPGWVRGKSPPAWRPGMPRVIQLNNGFYFLVFENIGILPDGTQRYGVNSFKTSVDGINWGDPEDPGTLIIAGEKESRQCPAVALLDNGNPNGRLFIRGMGDTCSPSLCFTSTDNGQTWQLIDAPLTAVRNEAVGSNWSSSFLALENRLIELNNYYNGSYNEIRCGISVFSGGQMLVSNANYRITNVASGLYLDNTGDSLFLSNQMTTWNDITMRSQSWHFIETGSEWYKVTGSNGLSEHHWKLIPAGTGVYKIWNQSDGLFLDTENQRITPSTPVVPNKENNNESQLWKAERIFDIARFESSNLDGKFIRHINTEVVLGSQFTSLPLKDSEWRIIPGLADIQHISLESVNKPGFYLRHYNGEVILSQNDETGQMRADATWIVRQGLSGSEYISLETYGINGSYMRHFNGSIIVSQIHTDSERDDASFRMILQGE